MSIALSQAFLLNCELSCPSKNDKVHAGPIRESPNAPNSISVPLFVSFCSSCSFYVFNVLEEMSYSNTC